MTTAALTDYRILTIIQEEVTRFLSEQESFRDDDDYYIDDKGIRRKYDWRRAELADGSTVLQPKYMRGKDGKDYISYLTDDGKSRVLKVDDLQGEDGKPLKSYEKFIERLFNAGDDKFKAKIGQADLLPVRRDEPAKQAMVDFEQGFDKYRGKYYEILGYTFIADIVSRMVVGLSKRGLSIPIAKQMAKGILGIFASMGSASALLGNLFSAGFKRAFTTLLIPLGLSFSGWIPIILSIAAPILLDYLAEWLIVEKDIFGVRGGIGHSNPAEQKRLAKLKEMERSGKKLYIPVGKSYIGEDLAVAPIPVLLKFCKDHGRPPKAISMSCQEIKDLRQTMARSEELLDKEFNNIAAVLGKSQALKDMREDFPEAEFDMAGFVGYKKLDKTKGKVVDEPASDDVTTSDIQGPEGSSTSGKVSMGVARSRGKASMSDKAQQLQVANKLGTSIQKIQGILASLYGEEEILPRYGVDNKYGSETKAAIERFQKDNGLEQTGIFGEKEFEVVNSAIEKAKKEQADVS